MTNEKRIARLEMAIYELFEIGEIGPMDENILPNAMVIWREIYDAPIKEQQKKDEIAEYVRLKKKLGH